MKSEHFYSFSLKFYLSLLATISAIHTTNLPMNKILKMVRVNIAFNHDFQGVFNKFSNDIQVN